MKKINFLILMAVAVSMFFQFSCSTTEDDVPPIVDTTKKDTVKPVVILNKFELGVTKYALTGTETNAVGYYVQGDDRTVISVVGFNGSTPVSFELEFPGKSVGNYVYRTHSPFSARFIISELGKIDYRDFAIDQVSGKTFNINISSYGEVGKEIKGTFSGDVTTAQIQPTKVQKGEFVVTRIEQ